MAKKVPSNKKTTTAKKQPVNKEKTNPETQVNLQSDIPPPSPSSYEMFARKKEYGVVSMTEQASMRADETRPRSVEMPKRIQNSIHVIRKDK